MGIKTDVVIIGSNLSGSMLASILAKNGVGVTIVDPKTHPKFTIGEATTPDSSCRFRIVGEKYGIPVHRSCKFRELSLVVLMHNILCGSLATTSGFSMRRAVASNDNSVLGYLHRPL